MHYQPVVRLSDDAIVGVEALLRWRHPQLGMILPATFVPVAEQSGTILEIGQRVFAEACRCLAGWRETLPAAETLTVGVNLSSRQLNDPELGTYFEQALTAAALPASAMVVELHSRPEPAALLQRRWLDAPSSPRTSR